MNYKETVQYLYDSVPMFQNVGSSAYKEGLHNTLVLDEHFGHPHEYYKTIHIAGTNGKGSCAHLLAAILQLSGYNVGLYTSPHLQDFRERIRVNGKCISEKYVVDFVKNERNFFKPLHPSFFELTTALAFKYFADQEIDIAVIEVGLGGRLDCTNIITPILSVITNISYDHTQFLGDTLAKIAGEKAGIIKHGVPVVIGEATEETRPVFVMKARLEDAPIVFAEDEEEVVSCKSLPDGGFEYETHDFGVIDGGLGGSYQEKNTNTVLCAVKKLKELGINIDNKNVQIGMMNVAELTGLLGRWQIVHDDPTVVCDTGHNVGGWEYISAQLEEQLKEKRCKTMRIVFGMVDDKDYKAVMKMLPKKAVIYLTKAKSKRALDEQILLEEGKKLGLDVTAFPDVKTAYEKAMKDSNKQDFVFVGGSSYIVADFLNTM
ncbi:MAG: bifunctional folylpolyglutamate synthase/dihydrofolate synthase, partial [Prevotella sp.]|nr:bifunctional folylpolyglutamate synthase/dihydrofolate synthase [Prevotella sp.]